MVILYMLVAIQGPNLAGVIQKAWQTLFYGNLVCGLYNI